MIITVLRALVHSADGKSENNFISGYTLTFPLSKSQNDTCFSVFPDSEFAEKLCIIKNSMEASLSDF